MRQYRVRENDGRKLDQQTLKAMRLRAVDTVERGAPGVVGHRYPAGRHDAAYRGRPPAPVRPAVERARVEVKPLAPEHYKIQFTIPQTTHDKLRLVQDLMRHTNPNGDPGVIFDRALTLLLNHLEKSKLAHTTRPRKQQRAPRAGSRHVPSAVKREVWARDDGQCAFVGTAGRCSETGFLEYHHVMPFADGGDTVAASRGPPGHGDLVGAAEKGGPHVSAI